MREMGQEIVRSVDRLSFIGGSDARVIMGVEEAALLRLLACGSS
jgi:hypothetical protein